ncbi:hypothetical protein AB0M43_17600 [Longispora sp. NPDC051575]|uniref:NACHT domain-containing protein n=1 Tax=Longispora sp. NPDC051575 TaxID=3154943 RepID=UPI00343F49C1
MALAIVLMIVSVLIWLSPKSLGTLDSAGSVGSFILGLLSFGISIITFVTGKAPETTDTVLDHLSGLVREESNREATRLHLTQAESIAVEWRMADEQVTPSAADLSKVVPGISVGGYVTRFKTPDTNDIAAIPALLMRTSHRQLVIIGVPGSGKSTTALLLTRGLLEMRATDRSVPVPVRVNLSDWRPDSEDFQDWFIAHLRSQYPPLKRSLGAGDGATVLLNDKRIIPVLDGLDEVPPSLRALAITKLTAAIGADRPCVMTCRSKDYTDAIVPSGRPLGRAFVVELSPVTGTQAAAYLPSGQTAETAARWRPIGRYLRKNPDSEVARALATPLMLYLARTAYTAPDTDPTELLTETASSIRKTLTGRYLQSIYAEGELAAARKYLGFLAQHLTDLSSTEIAWWRLTIPVDHVKRKPLEERNVPDRVKSAILVQQLFVFIAAFAGALSVGKVVALIVAMLCGVALQSRWRQPNQLSSPWRTAAVPLTVGISVGIWVGWFYSPDFGPASGAVAALLTIPYVAYSYRKAGRPESDLLNARRSLRGDALPALLIGVPAALLAGTSGYQNTGSLLVAAGGIGFGITVVLSFGSKAHAGSAWVRYQFTRSWLALTGRIPWRFISFLEDAHRRGILRQTGATYQFRHISLQEALNEYQVGSAR